MAKRHPILDKLFGSQKLQAEAGSNLCLYPFFNVMMVADGTYQPCCKYSGRLSHQGKTLRAPEDSIQDAWDSDSMKKLRAEFMAGAKPEGCSVCWQEEAAGIKSMRYDGFDYGIREDQLSNPETPKRLDVYPSNICNLRCRICSPEYSSRWIPEAKETLGLDGEIHINLNETNLAQVKEWLPQMTEIGLFGGEPLYLKETAQLLEYCVEEGYSQQIKLLINTNGTIYSQKLTDLFGQFKKVLLNFSIDDVEKRFEFQRSGAAWEPVIANIHRYVEAGGYRFEDRIESKMCCTVSCLNVWYLPEYLDWLRNEFPGMKVFLNLLHGPYSLSIRNLPASVKEAVAARLDAIDTAGMSFEDKATRTLGNIRNFLMSDPDLSFDEFFREIRRGDAYRKESFAETFPEFWEMIRKFEVPG
jgi:sulfatase maturation enzyme AslB (radical SAM superfamily)